MSIQQARGMNVKVFLQDFLSGTANLHLGFKNFVFKAKVIFQVFVNKWWNFKSLQRTKCNPGPLAKIPQMIFLQKESSQSTKWVDFRAKEIKKVSFIKCQRETLESGFEHEIYSNGIYKDPISLLLLSLCIQNTCKRDWARVGAKLWADQARDPSDQARDPSKARDPSSAFQQCYFLTGATRWVRRETRQRPPYQITCKFIQGAKKIAKLPKVGPPTYKLLLVMVKDIMNTFLKISLCKRKSSM